MRRPSMRKMIFSSTAIAVLTAVVLGLSPPPGFPSARPGWAVELALRHELAQASAAPAGTAVTLRGKIVALAGQRLGVETATGTVWVTLVEPVTVTGVAPAKLSDITPGTFIGTAATRQQADGTFRALEVHIFPEAMRGAGEGHRPWDLPDTIMTNANVEEVVQNVEGSRLTLRYPGGGVTVVVPKEAPIVRFVPGDRDLLKPGAGVFIFRATRAADGSISTSRISVGVGITPPM
jgi:hypothetical protein